LECYKHLSEINKTKKSKCEHITRENLLLYLNESGKLEYSEKSIEALLNILG